VGILERNGFSRAFNLEGGIQAWRGLTAEGPPEAGMTYFASGTGAADMVSLAWALEEATRQFYTNLAHTRSEEVEAELFGALATAEEHHKETLARLNDKLTSEPVSRMYDNQSRRILEGGMDMEAARQWSLGKTVAQILEMALGLESNAYDRYLKMFDATDDDLSKEVFRTIAAEEKNHLARLAELMDSNLRAKT
jgi:rubrerythrin